MFNVSGSPIPTSVLLGPYTGAVIAKKDYKKESGYGWEIRDGDKDKPVAIVDPGPNPDPNAHILAMVNSTFKVVFRLDVFHKVVATTKFHCHCQKKREI